MTSKIVMLTLLVVVNLFGLLALLSNIFNLPFKAFFGYSNEKTGNKKVYWFGHIIIVLLIFYFWKEITASEPSFFLIFLLLVSSIISIVLSKKNRSIYRRYRIFYISNTVKWAFVYNLVLLYILGLFFNEIGFSFF